MSLDEGDKPNVNNFRAIHRKPVRFTQETVIRTSYVDPERQFPLVVQPNIDSFNLAAWAEGNKDYIEDQLLKFGAILFRGFDTKSVSQFEEFVKKISPELLDYRERAAPRKEIHSRIYTSTEYPADQYIPLHHEMSYSHNWPAKIWFFCVLPAQQGGRTPIASDREVFQRIPQRIKDKFIQKKVMYVRNYGEGVDIPWQEVFQSSDKSVVEEYCRKAHAEFEWLDNNRLRTRAIRQVVATHPKTGDTVWFNHSHMFHISNLEASVRESLLAAYEEDELPRNAFYGDGSPIESSVLNEIREIYTQCAVRFPWEKGDILMLDNFLTSHGREPYIEPRKILVAMADLFTNTDI